LISNNKLIIDEHVEGLPRQGLAAIIHPHGHLASHAVASCNQLRFECERADVFSTTVPERSMSPEERADNGMSTLFLQPRDEVAGNAARANQNVSKN
jgi:hypothetical protein